MIRPSKKEIISYIDIDNDSDNEEFILSDGFLKVYNDHELIYASDPKWTVQEIEYGDCNNDSIDEIIIGFFRIGDYGIDNKFSRIRRDPKPSYHIYLYQYIPLSNSFRLIWGSSTLNDPIYEMTLEEINTDNKILKVINGSYEDYDKKGILMPLQTTYWIWDDWYFKQIDTSNE